MKEADNGGGEEEVPPDNDEAIEGSETDHESFSF